jgi:hypothetical protein
MLCRLIDMLGFEKELELSDDTKTIEIPTRREVPEYTFRKSIGFFEVLYFIFEREGNGPIFRMKSITPHKPIYWIEE